MPASAAQYYFLFIMPFSRKLCVYLYRNLMRDSMKEIEISRKERVARGVIVCSGLLAGALQLVQRATEGRGEHLLAFLTVLSLGGLLWGFAMLSRQSRWRIMALLFAIIGAAFVFVSVAYLAVGPVEQFEWTLLSVGVIFALLALVAYRRYQRLLNFEPDEKNATTENKE